MTNLGGLQCNAPGPKGKEFPANRTEESRATERNNRLTDLNDPGKICGNAWTHQGGSNGEEIKGKKKADRSVRTSI